MLDLLNGFIIELRNAGLPVSLTENLDAMEAVQHIPIEDREAFKYALAATLVKNQSHWRAFEIVFEVFFSLRGAEYRIGAGDETGDVVEDAPDDTFNQGEGAQQAGGGGGSQLTPEQIAEMLFQALLRGDNSMMRAIARQSVRRYAGMEPGRPVGGTYYLYRTLRNLDLDGMLDKLKNLFNWGPFKLKPDPAMPSLSDIREKDPQDWFKPEGKVEGELTLDPDFAPKKSPKDKAPTGPKFGGPQCERKPQSEPGHRSCTD